MKVFIVHAHHEPNSFCSAMFEQTHKQLEKAGHEVVVSNLYRMRFDPVSDRRNFKTVKDTDYLKQQQEEMYATDHNGFADDVEQEIKRLEECDAIIFTFPLWWFGLPAILKGWCDKVLAMGRVYGGDRLYENGIGKSKKRGLILMTTGGSELGYSGWGYTPPMDVVLQPIQQGIFWFNGILPLEPFVAWSPARVGQEAREDYLKQLETKIDGLFSEKPIVMMRMADFPDHGYDAKQRFHVVASGNFDFAVFADLKRDGWLLDCDLSADGKQAFMKMRAADESELRSNLGMLAKDLSLHITQLKPFTVTPAQVLRK